MDKTEKATKLLIVNPDPEFNRTLSTNLLSNHSFELMTVGSAPEAMDLLRSKEFHILLTSDQLDNVNGLDFALEVRKEFISRPEIIILADDPHLSLRSCHQAGASYMVQKPINIEQLCTAIHRMAAVDRRIFDRVYINPAMLGHLFGKVTLAGKKDSEIEVSNLGRGGFFFKSHQRDLPVVGQIIDFNLTLGMVPDTHFKGKGIIRWVKKEGMESGAGVEFLSIPEESEKLVFAFVDLFKVKPFVPDEC